MSKAKILLKNKTQRSTCISILGVSQNNGSVAHVHNGISCCPKA